MNINNLSLIEHANTLENIPLNIDINYFINLKELILKTFQKLRINPENLCIFYQRQENGTSILAIKVEKGSDEDITRYMFNGSTVNYGRENIHCDVYLHAEAASAQKSVNIAGLISRDIVKFFEDLETDLLLKDLTDCSFSLRIPLQEKTYTQEKNNLKKTLKAIFQKFK